VDAEQALERRLRRRALEGARRARLEGRGQGLVAKPALDVLERLGDV